MQQRNGIRRKPEEWEIVYNTREGIVTQEEFANLYVDKNDCETKAFKRLADKIKKEYPRD